MPSAELRAHRRLVARGIGSSREAVENKRLRHIRHAREAIQSGARLPGWIALGTPLATPENIDKFLEGFDNPQDRAKAAALLDDLKPRPDHS